MYQVRSCHSGAAQRAGPETMNTCFVNVFAGLCSWLPGSRAVPAPRNDKIFEFPDSDFRWNDE